MDASSANASSKRPRLYAWYILTVLTLCYTLSFVDSKITFVLVEGVKRDLHLSDTVIGLVNGPAFSLVYAITALPLASFSDRRSRKKVISIAILIWSAFTAAGGFAHTATQLLISRAGVAFAEAALTPAAHSLIADYFSASAGRAISIYMTGSAAGTTISLAAGGLIARYYGWRTSMLVVGSLGLLMSLMVAFTVRESKRAFLTGTQKNEKLPVSVLSMLKSKPILHTILGGTFICVTLGASVSWTPAYVMRHFSMEIGSAGVSLGATTGITVLFGTAMGGFINDFLMRKRAGLEYKFLFLCFMAYGVIRIASFFVESYLLFLLLSSLSGLLMMLYSGPTFSSVQSMVSPESRSRASALTMLCVNGLGVASGTFFTGFLSDRLAPSFGVDSLRISMICMSFAAFPAAWQYRMAGRAKAVERVREAAIV